MEYLGVRFTMLEAIQRYHAAGDITAQEPAQKIDSLKELVFDSASHNKLLGQGGALIGQSWQRLIDSKPAEDVIKFVEHPTIKKMVEDLPDLNERAPKMGLGETMGYVMQNMTALKPMVLGFENLAQETGLINYKGGESLSGQISHFKSEICAENNIKPSTDAPIAGTTRNNILNLFNSENGIVGANDLPPSATNPKSGIIGTVLSGALALQGPDIQETIQQQIKPAEIRTWKGKSPQPPRAKPGI